MTELSLHGKGVGTVFDLLGAKENDITKALGWALARSPCLVSQLVETTLGVEAGEILGIRLQEFVEAGGITDIEVDTENAQLVIEAKRGWTLPAASQLELYAPRLKSASGAVVSMSECSVEWAKPRLPQAVGDGIPVVHLSWKEIHDAVEAVAGESGQNEKRLLREFARYLRGLMTMQKQDSNMVYVVSLGKKELFESSVNFADIVLKHDRYFHPVGGGKGGWPKEPPNYIGFRFDGKLQQIRHVEGYEIHENPWQEVPGLSGKPDWEKRPHFFYFLGPPIVPPHDVKMGKLWATARVWAALDLLLTCKTVSEARDLTNMRLAEAGLS